jgi:hypothetical protein
MSNRPPARQQLPETRGYIDASGNYVRERPGVRTTVVQDDKIYRWATAQRVSGQFLEWCKNSRDQNKRAPLGDSHGAWQKVAEIPMTLFMEKLPPHAWEDKKAIAKLANDPDLRLFRTDGDFRRL